LHKNYPKLNEFLSELNVNIIKCAFHSLALTQSGEVYAWVGIMDKLVVEIIRRY
jgi:alpha-tubulin suppressor-like RCC1 family protein